MDQSVFLDADVDKTSEIRDVSDDARQHLPFFQVFDRLHRWIERKYLDGLARIASRLIQFFHNIQQSRHSDFVRDVFLQVELFLQFFIADQFDDSTFQVLCHQFDDRITFRMDGRVVQWVFTILDTKETSTLFKSLFSHAGYFQEFATRLERSVFGSVVDDVLC